MGMNMIEYMSCGNIMSDTVVDDDGKISRISMGGPAFYALSGIRLWTKNVKLVSQTGADFADSYGKWMKLNGITEESVRYELEHLTQIQLHYDQNDKGFSYSPKYSLEYLGYLKTHPRDIDEAADGYPIKGIYMANDTDRIVWEKLNKVKQKHGFKIMWELEYKLPFFITKEDYQDAIRKVLPFVDIWSLNYNEASAIFGIERNDDEAIIKKIQDMPANFCFYRVGVRGSFMISRTEAVFCPSITPAGPAVDPTGCGNCSTGAAMYAFVSGHSLAETAAMANVSAGYNVSQFGVWPEYSEAIMENAALQARKLLKKTVELR